MKRILLVMVAMLFFNLIYAQNNYTDAEKAMAGKISQKMKTELNLTQDQFNKVHAVNLEVVRRINLASNGNSNNVALQSTTTNVNSYSDDEFKKVLTSQQYLKLKSNVNGRKCVVN